MKISTFIHDPDSEGKTLKKYFVAALEERYEVIDQDKCICKLDGLPKREDLGDLVIIHPDDDNRSGCYDAISKFVEQFPEVSFYILALQDFARDEPRVKGIGPHSNVTYITDENSRKVVVGLMSL